MPVPDTVMLLVLSKGRYTTSADLTLGRSPADTDEIRDLLSGVARSVMYDHRQLIRDALEAAA